MKKRGMFACALCGLGAAIKSERNLRIHICAAFYVAVAAAMAGFDAVRWCILLICCAMVISLELVNTAAERLCDEVNAEYSERIRFIKDSSAGAVLAVAIFSACIGGVLFFRKSVILAIWSTAIDCPVISVAAILMLIPAAFFIQWREKK